jgi:dipeptidyl aminopeptidase/acylaminoacyl peptidase
MMIIDPGVTFFTDARAIVLKMRRALPLLLAAAAMSWLLAACDSSDDDDARDLIVYEATTDDITNIFTIDAETGESRQITDAVGFDGNPSWSPDRDRIVFSSSGPDDGRYDIYVMDADGENRRQLTNTPDDGELSPRYSPDGERLAFVSDTGAGWYVRVMDADGAEPQDVAGPFYFAEFPAWTLDGEELYFAAIEEEGASATGGPADIYAASQESDGPHIYSVDLETLDVHSRIRTAGIDVCPHVTPDGEHLLYASTVTADNSNHAIFVHELDSADTTGASDTRLTDPVARNDYPDPAPDGSLITFTSVRDGNVELYVMNTDGTDQRRLTNTPDTRENVPDW